MRRYVLLLWLAVLILTAAFLSPLMAALSAAVEGAFDPDQVCVSSMVVEAGRPAVTNPMTCSDGN